MSYAKHLAALVALVLGGCSLIIDDNTTRVTNRCTADVDCSNGAHCATGSSMCVQEPSLPYDLWLQIAPPVDANGSTPVPVDLGPYRMFAGTLPLPVPHEINARGTVRREGVPISAQITFTPRMPSPIGARSVSTRTVSGGGSVDFTTTLPARGDYDVLVEPLGEFRATVPPYRYEGLSVGVTDAALQIPLPADETHVEGDLVDASGGVSDFEIFAVDRATGARLSSIDTASAEPSTLGHFSIALRPTTTAFDLVIRPTTARAAMGPVPTYRVRPEVLLPDPMGHVQILVPAAHPPVHWAGWVEYPESRGSAPVAGAVVQLHSDDVVDAATGVVGSLDLTLTTDMLGAYDGQVLPGTYTVAVTAGTSADDVLGVLRETRDLRPTAGGSEILGHVFRLPLRTVLTGTVQSPDGDLMRDASVRATPLGLPLMGLTDPDVARFARPTTSRSGPMGDFRLDLDVGVYDIVVEPPESSGFPWTVVLDYGIGGSTATLADVMQVDAPVVVECDVTWLDGGVLASGEVRAFAITPDDRAVMVGRGTSDTQGHVRMLVPAALGNHDPTMAFRRR